MDEMEILNPKTGKSRYTLNADGDVTPSENDDEKETDEPNDSAVPPTRE